MSVNCRLCGVALHRAADPVTDTYVWADADGHQTGADPDVAHLRPDPSAYLAALGERIRSAPKGSPDWAAGREYSALKVRLDVGGTCHVHWPDGNGPPHAGPLPWCCGWPGWLRPSGWQCRRCGAALAVEGVA
ncbi:MAG TPA: hypothetical protein VMV92_39350 [Streptosporangiaceae bacterium]|nr:hypothetical protein [Streptosporangiaceae bacterium]